MMSSLINCLGKSVARLLTGMRKREHITPIRASLHWLPVRFRIDFKILVLVF